jgi:hypothetical protein
MVRGNIQAKASRGIGTAGGKKMIVLRPHLSMMLDV